MRGYLLISILCALFCVGFGDERNTNNAAASADPFSQKIDAEMVPDSLSVKWDMRKGTMEEFLSAYGNKINTLKELEIEGMTNKMTDTLLQSVSELLTTSECSLVSVTLKGIQDRFCPSMKREEKKRPCKMSREAILRQFPVVFAKCPLEEFSIETNAFSATGIIELVQHMTSGQFPSLRFLNIDDNNYNFDNIALPRLVRIVNDLPSSIDVRSFYIDTANVITHNHGIDTPFRYNFEQRYPADCAFYSEPIKDEEFEILVKYQPCIFARSLLAHGTSRGAPWVAAMTAMFRNAVFTDMRNMEIFGNELVRGDLNGLFDTFTAEHFPSLQSLDMSSNGLVSVRISRDFLPALEKLMLDTNELTSVVIEAGALPKLDSLKLGYNHLTEFSAGEGALPRLQKLYLDNNHLQPDVVRSVVNAPFSKSLTILSLFNNPTIAEKAEEFVQIFTEAIKNGRFENLKMLYLGQCGLKPYCSDLQAVAKEYIPTDRKSVV